MSRPVSLKNSSSWSKSTCPPCMSSKSKFEPYPSLLSSFLLTTSRGVIAIFARAVQHPSLLSSFSAPPDMTWWESGHSPLVAGTYEKHATFFWWASTVCLRWSRGRKKYGFGGFSLSSFFFFKFLKKLSTSFFIEAAISSLDRSWGIALILFLAAFFFWRQGWRLCLWDGPLFSS
jgi:hypothetical protein